MPKSTGTFAEVLRQNGYNTAWYGKNHNVPDWHNSQAGPFDLWPTGRGFEYFYGFIGGDTSQWAPAIFENIKPIEPPHDDKDYFFDKDMADKAIARIRLLHAVASHKPWVTYYAPGTAHAPHHAPKDWIAKFKGQFDQGWDKVREETLARQKKLGIVPQDTKLTARSAGIPAWDTLDADHKKVAARMMEVYAAALSYCDAQMGRIIDALADLGELDNTLVMYIQGDNGASAEGGPQGLLNEMAFFNATPEDFKDVLRRIDELGGPTTFNHYPIGWAHAMNTPFQWTKQIASHFGGTRNGNTVGVYRSTVASPDPLTPGTHTILLDFKYDGGLGKGGIATLLVDSKEVAPGRIERTIPFRISADETLDVGEDTGTPVSEEYQVPFKFTGDLKKVAIQLTDTKLSPEDEEEIRKIKAEIGLSQ
jgi:arylsulfatase